MLMQHRSEPSHVDRIAAMEREMIELRAHVAALLAVKSVIDEVVPEMRNHPHLPLLASGDWSYVRVRGHGIALTSRSQQQIIRSLWADSVHPLGCGRTAQELARAVGSSDARFNVRKCFCPSGGRGRRRGRREHPAWHALIQQIDGRFYLCANFPESSPNPHRIHQRAVNHNRSAHGRTPASGGAAATASPDV
jgi:hypothetical protein